MLNNLSFQAIEGYYRGNNDKNDENIGQPKFTQSWNLLRVVQHKMIKEINAQIEDKPGSRGYMGQFRRVSGNISRNLPLNVKREYLALADKWNHEKLPEYLQRRSVACFSGHWKSSVAFPFVVKPQSRLDKPLSNLLKKYIDKWVQRSS
jgi:hypothetical protein